MHIKTINGKQYYYESVRKGKKVTSRYIGPVEKAKKRIQEQEIVEEKEKIKQEDINLPDDSYIG
ncbi:MAG: hypothetical protein V1900_00415 [Candidatus Aenigmatarchaeota archaeon]